MKTRTVSIEVPELWIEQYKDAPHLTTIAALMTAEVRFRMALQVWLDKNAPCATCDGTGYVFDSPSGNELDPNGGETQCPDCNGQEWENPL